MPGESNGIQINMQEVVENLGRQIGALNVEVTTRDAVIKAQNDIIQKQAAELATYKREDADVKHDSDEGGVGSPVQG